MEDKADLYFVEKTPRRPRWIKGMFVNPCVVGKPVHVRHVQLQREEVRTAGAAAAGRLHRGLQWPSARWGDLYWQLRKVRRRTWNWQRAAPPALSPQAWTAVGRSSTPWRKATLWCSPAMTSKTASCGSRPCIAPLASPTSPSHQLRSRNSTPKGVPRPKWMLPFLSSVSSPKQISFRFADSNFSSTKQWSSNP